MESFVFDESWEIIRKVFPVDLEELARESGSFRRARMVGDAETLLRLLLMHGSGLSLEQTVLRAKEQGIGTISAVALFKRLRRSEAFLQKLASNVLKQSSSAASKRSGPGAIVTESLMRPPSMSPGRPGAAGASTTVFGCRICTVTILN